MPWRLTMTGRVSGEPVVFEVDAPRDAEKHHLWDSISPLVAERQLQDPPLERLGPPMRAEFVGDGESGAS